MRKVHGWRRVTRWFVGIAGGLLGLIAVALVIAFIVFQTGWGRGVLKDQIAPRVSNMFVGGASIGSVEGNPLSELVLVDVAINGPDKQLAIGVKRLTIKLPLLPLLRHRLQIERLVAEELDVRVRRLADGSLNIARLMKPSRPSTWNVALPTVEIRRGHVLLDQIAGAEPIDIDELDASVDASLPFGGPLAANVHITGRWRQRDAPVSVGAVVRRDATYLELRNASVQIGDVRAIALGVKLPRSAFEKPLAGTVAISAPARAVHALLPSVTLPTDLAVSLTARSEGRLTAFRAVAAVGRGRLDVFARGDVQAKQATGVVVANDLDLHELTTGTLDGSGGGVAALRIDGTAGGALPAVTGMITVWSNLRDTPPVHAVVAIDSRGDRVLATLGAATDTGIRVGAGGSIRVDGQTLVLEHGDLVASTLDIRRAAAGKAAVRGSLTANLHARGRLVPHPDLSIAGHANGRKLGVQGVRVDRLALRIDAAHVPSHPTGSGRLELVNVERGDVKLGRVTIDANQRRDGKLQVALRSEPKPSPWRVDVDALVTTGETFVVELQRHLVRTAGGSTWTGDAGRLTIGPRKIELSGLRSVTQGGTFAADATYVRAGREQGDLSARVDASLALASLSATHKGHIDAHVDIQRKSRQFVGTVVATGRAISFDPTSSLAFDGDVEISAQPERMTANIAVSGGAAGSAKVELDVDTPKDVTNARAWRKLDRSAIRSARVTVSKVRLAALAPLLGVQRTRGMRGHVDGTVELSPTRAAGTLEIRDATIDAFSDLGSIDADLGLAPDGTDAVKATLNAHLVPSAAAEASQDVTAATAARLCAEASFATPERIFDPAAWSALDGNAFRGGTLRADRLAFRPGTLQRIGIVSSLRGELAAYAEVAAGLQDARVSVDIHELRGGVFAQAIAGRVTGTVDARSTQVTVDVRTQGLTLLNLSSELPITFEQLRANPARVMTAPITARARIDKVPVTAVMNVLGTNPMSGGTLDGVIDVAGTVARPTVDAKLVARSVVVPTVPPRAHDRGHLGRCERRCLDRRRSERGWRAEASRHRLTSRSRQRHGNDQSNEARPRATRRDRARAGWRHRRPHGRGPHAARRESKHRSDHRQAPRHERSRSDRAGRRYAVQSGHSR